MPLRKRQGTYRCLRRILCLLSFPARLHWPRRLLPAGLARTDTDGHGHATPLVPAPLATPIPSPIRLPSPKSVATEFGLSLSQIIDPMIKPVRLDSGAMQLEVTPGLREARINGVKQWLAFPVRQEGARVLISRLDLSKVIEPHLRPELIEGMPARDDGGARSRPRRARSRGVVAIRF